MFDSLPTRRILIVHADTEKARALALTLRRLGQYVRTAREGGQALGIARSMLPNIVFLGGTVPEGGAYPLAARLRELPHLRSLIIVVLGGDNETASKTTRAAVDFHLPEPLEIAFIKRLLGRRR